MLGELNAAHAAELFRQRAVAARPEVPQAGIEAVVAGIVQRLDRLPLVIELASGA